MALLADLGRFWLRPRAVMRERLSAMPSERVLLGWLVTACLIGLLMRLPETVAIGRAQGLPLTGLVGAAMVASLVFAPLFFYALAGGAQLVLWLMTGQRGLGQGSRLALFFTLLSVQPLALIPLLGGLLAGGTGAVAQAVERWLGWGVAAWAVALWLAALAELVRWRADQPADGADATP